MITTDHPANVIEVRITSIEQLFNSLDPFPFLDRDLDKAAEEFIVGWARELPAAVPIGIIIHLHSPTSQPNALDIETALHRYFAYRAEVIGRELTELFRIGRRSLAIGLAVLVLCVGLRELVMRSFGRDGIYAFVNEGLIILGWVANWKALEIFLYDWWPVAGHRNLYRRLARANVIIASPERKP
jgi:hypothetical protein